MKKKELMDKLKRFEDEEEIYLVSFAPQVSYHEFDVKKNGRAIMLNPTRRLSWFYQINKPEV